VTKRKKKQRNEGIKIKLNQIYKDKQENRDISNGRERERRGEGREVLSKRMLFSVYKFFVEK